MKTSITFRHMKTNPELHETAVREADGFDKFLDNIISTDVVFTNENDKIVEFTVRVKGDTLIARDRTEDFSKSLHSAADKMVRQLRKLKTKRLP